VRIISQKNGFLKKFLHGSLRYAATLTRHCKNFEISRSNKFKKRLTQLKKKLKKFLLPKVKEWPLTKKRLIQISASQGCKRQKQFIRGGTKFFQISKVIRCKILDIPLISRKNLFTLPQVKSFYRREGQVSKISLN